MTVGSMGSQLFHSGERRHGQTDEKQLIVAFAILRTHLKFQIVPYREKCFSTA